MALLLSGCSRGKVVTKVASDGSWIRRVELHGPGPDKTGGMVPIPKLEDTFAVPGAPWVITHEKKDADEFLVCTRSMKPGESLSNDVVCKAKTDKGYVPCSQNQCSVKQTGPGEYTYTETIHWVGAKPTTSLIDVDVVKHLRAVLPAGLATDASLKRVSTRLSGDIMRVFLGPPEPLFTTILSQAMMAPDLAEHKISAEVGEKLAAALTDEYGSRLTAAQRTTAVEKLVAETFKSTAGKTDFDPTKPPSKDNGSLVSLTFSIKLPGKIIKTNGNIDHLSNEVYWGLYPEAAAMGQDIVLTATCRL